MSSYKLYYFNARGGGEPARIIFAQAEVKYEDIRFEDDQWKSEYKDSKYLIFYRVVIMLCVLLTAEMPFGRAPVLEVDGTMVAGSMNILRYLGNKFGEDCMNLVHSYVLIISYNWCNLMACQTS